MIFKMARDRTDDGKDVKRGAVIKDNNGYEEVETALHLRLKKARRRQGQIKCG